MWRYSQAGQAGTPREEATEGGREGGGNGGWKAKEQGREGSGGRGDRERSPPPPAHQGSKTRALQT